MNEWNDRNKGQTTDLNAFFQDEEIMSPVALDITRSVMGRLGYMKVSDRVANRKRRRRGWGRALASVLAIAICGGGLLLHQGGAEVLRPQGLTVPGALGQDLDRGQHQLIRAIRFIRSHAPIPVESDSPSEAPVEDTTAPNPDESTLAIGPVRWI